MVKQSIKCREFKRGEAPLHTNLPLSFEGFVLEGLSPKEEGD